jgi:hypothetical protein
MSRAGIATAVVLVLLAVAPLGAQAVPGERKDPPRQLEGTVKKVDGTAPGAGTLMITAREMKPTGKEDMMEEVARDYSFRVNDSTLIMAVNGKPDRKGLKGLEPGARVRVEYTNNRALQVTALPPR